MRELLWMAGGLGLVATAAVLAILAGGPQEDILEAVAIVLAPLGGFLAVEGYLRHRRRGLA